MKPLILASNSPQRKKLLQQLGVRFKVKPSRAPEKSRITSTCARLVQDNALIKARSVAGKEKDAVVIGADTVVYLGDRKILGKPKDLRQARRQLKLLFSKPRWVYTGVAVIDAKTGRSVVGYEKTRVFMVPLSRKEVDSYHRKVSPLDKAGGFDIEGWGSAFIHRIEGCYSNVIGLPMARLAKMLKEFEIKIL